MTNLFQTAGYGTENNFENITSKHHLELILKSYIESMNKDSEDIGNNWHLLPLCILTSKYKKISISDIVVFFYAGLAVNAVPHEKLLKKGHGMILDRVGILHDVALVMGDESFVPVSQVQNMLLKLNSKVKRVVLILDCRMKSNR